MIEAHLYGKYVERQMSGASPVDWASDTIKCMLTTSEYEPNQDTDEFRSSVTHEVTGTGYAAGGVTLTGNAVAYNASTNEVAVTAGDVEWAEADFTARRAVIYKSTGVAATDVLIGWVDFGANQSPAGIKFGIEWPGEEIFKATVS